MKLHAHFEKDRIFKFGRHFPVFMAYEIFCKIAVCSYIILQSITHFFNSYFLPYKHN